MHGLIIDETTNVFRRSGTGKVSVTSRPPGVSIRTSPAPRPRRGRFWRAAYTSRAIRTTFPFNEVVPSWNVDVPEGCGFRVELRVGRRKGDFWTPFYDLGSWASVPERRSGKLEDKHGLVDVDYFRSTQLFDRIQYRVHLHTDRPVFSPVLRRFALACSDTLGDGPPRRGRGRRALPGPRARWSRRLPVPFRSQALEHPKIRWSICSPTSVAMVMSYYGVDRPTDLMARLIYDRRNSIYGNWWRAVQGAYTFGVPGYLERFSDWDGVKRHLANGRPVIASIRVDKGQLRGAPYNYSGGHLLVIAGFDRRGNVHVNDPAARTPKKGLLTYAREDMETVWFDRRGVGYVLLPVSTTAAASRPQ